MQAVSTYCPGNCAASVPPQVDSRLYTRRLSISNREMTDASLSDALVRSALYASVCTVDGSAMSYIASQVGAAVRTALYRSALVNPGTRSAKRLYYRHTVKFLLSHLGAALPNTNSKPCGSSVIVRVLITLREIIRLYTVCPPVSRGVGLGLATVRRDVCLWLGDKTMVFSSSFISLMQSQSQVTIHHHCIRGFHLARVSSNSQM
ncbi:hypothetical protein BD779DRAFT_611589 [Infundibulicybe gibba]|nr:hypothetical protein BD779DRAFT_611589 [Infundibulicybe gibba]